MDVAKLLRRVYAISWLSWQELSNWTHPAIFMAYTLVRPIFGILLYAYIYVAFAISSGKANPSAAFYLITGVSFYNYIGNGIYGVVWVIHEERDHYRLLKYTYVSYPSLQGYLAARGLVHYVIGFILSLVSIGIGFTVTGLSPSLQPNIPLLIVNLIVGMAWCTSIGITVSSLSLFSSEYGPLISESVGGLLFLVGSVIFPAKELPPWLYTLSEALPMKEWMELMRHSINTSYVPGNVQGLLVSQLMKALFYVTLSYVVFKALDRLVRLKGGLEATLEH
ncbi:MAG: hypothetical protein DRJ41_01190 [Thermoprotei archaeon]|nr:MAG: hypothetical protein DRJ41_01190 [Thermoprotei archaeon]